MRNAVKVIGLVAVCALIAFVLWKPESHHIEEEEAHHNHDFLEFDHALLKTHGITTEQAAAGTLHQRVRAPAQIVIGSDQEAHVLPKASGIAINAYKNLGEHVEPNDLLATLESKEMAEAKSSYFSSEKKEQLTKKTYLREKDLHDKKITSTEDFNAAENAWEEALIDLELSRQKLHALGLNEKEIDTLSLASPSTLRLYEIRSPIAGKVISRHITLGELVNTEQEVYVIADLTKVWANISIFAQDRPFVKQGQTVTITANNNRSTKAKIIYLSPIIDEETRTSSAIAEIDNASEDWLPGTFAQAELITAEQPVAIIVPREAVQNIEGENALFILAENGFAVRPIITGKADESHFEVLSGLNAGETYASKNTFLLKAELQKDEAEHMD